LQEDLQNQFLQDKVADCRKKVLALSEESAQWVSDTIDSTWLIQGDRGTKLFLGQHKFKVKAKETFIHQIKDSTGKVVTQWEEIAGAGVA
jgi:hypothetical protein